MKLEKIIPILFSTNVGHNLAYYVNGLGSHPAISQQQGRGGGAGPLIRATWTSFIRTNTSGRHAMLSAQRRVAGLAPVVVRHTDRAGMVLPPFMRRRQGKIVFSIDVSNHLKPKA